MAAAGVSTLVCEPAWSQQAQSAGAPALGDAFWSTSRTLRLVHVSGETTEQPYWVQGAVHMPGYLALCRFLRDRVVQETVTIDVTLLDILYGINGWLAYYRVPSSFIVTSGHRERRRNSHIEGAVLDSRHVTGQAVDGYIPGVDPLMLARFAWWLGAGGVGWYPQRGFVHVDTGRRRSWRG